MLLDTVTSSRRLAIVSLGATLTLWTGGAHAVAAQSAPAVYYACYVPLTGTVYRIKETGLKQACTSTTHVEFSWTDGANAVRVTDLLGGDLTGLLASAKVVKLLGRALSATPPTVGQVLAWDGTAWVPTTASSGVTDHGALTGLLDDDHPQYLLNNGVRASTNGFAVTGTAGAGSLLVSGAGTRLLWYPGKAAFRAGRSVGTEWDDAQIGGLSVAMGDHTTASGTASTALGFLATATGQSSIAMGQNTMASAHWSMAAGLNSTASGQVSTALGNSTTASGDFSIAMGEHTTTYGQSSIAMGDHTTAYGHSSIAMGSNTVATGNQSMAAGIHATAAGESSTAIGSNVAAYGNQATVLGTNATTSAGGSFVYGDASTTTSFVTASAPNQFVVRASGGFLLRTATDLSTGCNLPTGSGTWSCTSSRFAKNNFADLNGDAVLGKIARMPIQTWSYRTEPGRVRHVGPTAQDFRAAFGLGTDDKTISLVDIDGINLLGVQALERRTRALEQENAELRARLERLEAALKRP